MSAMFPPSINIGGGDPGAGAPPSGPAGAPPLGGPPAGGSDGPDSPKVEQLLDQAKSLIVQAEGLEKDHEDKAKLMKMAAELQAFLGSSQKLNDSAMGAGPGVKLIRKAGPGGLPGIGG
jgi:hypothetical protein